MDDTASKFIAKKRKSDSPPDRKGSKKSSQYYDDALTDIQEGIRANVVDYENDDENEGEDEDILITPSPDEEFENISEFQGVDEDEDVLFAPSPGEELDNISVFQGEDEDEDIMITPSPDEEFKNISEFQGVDEDEDVLFAPSPGGELNNTSVFQGEDEDEDIMITPSPDEEFKNISEFQGVDEDEDVLFAPSPGEELNNISVFQGEDEDEDIMITPSPDEELDNISAFRGEDEEEDLSDGEDDCEDGRGNENSANTCKVKVYSKSAFNEDTKTYRIHVESLQNDVVDADTFFSSAQKMIEKILGKAIEKIGEHKAVFNLHGTLIDNAYEEFDINDTVLVTLENKDSRFELVRKNIVQDFNSENGESKQISYLNVHIHRGISVSESYLPYSSYRRVVNVRNKDHESFKWAVLAGLHPEIYNPGDHTLEEYSEELILDEIEHPVQLRDIPRIEEMNNMSFNVYVLKYNFSSKSEEIEGPVYYTKNRKDAHFNLLLLHDGPRSHYCYITDLGGLVDEKKKGHIICDGCLCFFASKNNLETHQNRDCPQIKTVMPKEDKKITKFRDDDQGKKMPIVVYADFEAYIEPIQDITSEKKKTEPDTYTKNVSEHVPFSFAYYIKCSANDNLSHLQTYHGLDCDKMFIRMLKRDLKRICKEVKGVDVIPVFFHNFSNYDAHFVVRNINSVPGAVSVLGGKFNFIAIHKRLIINGKEVELRILDSIKFVKGSLDSLTKNLGRDQFTELRKFWGGDDEFNLLSKKGAFPYEYITCLQDLNRTSLPEKKLFYSSVKASHISDEEYQRAFRVWDQFECKTIKDYSEIYLKTDVLLLADVFENLRRVSLDTYQIDPARFYSMSAVTWEAMLKITGVELELLTDVDMVTFFKKAMRGGIAHCCRRYATANNKYLPDTYDEDKIDSYLMYYDASNLYGWAMSQPLPYRGFEWVDIEVDFKVPADSSVGFLLEVDLEYPNDEELQDQHADFPFCPEKKIIPTVKGERLVTDLTSKKKYVLHHSYLIQCLNHGLVLKKVHRVLKFNQRPWLKPYIDYNTNLRAKATTDVEKDFYKQMNNSLYGKTIQNIEKYVDVKAFDHWFDRGYRRGGYNMTGRPEYHSHDIISENLIMVQLNKTKLVHKDPIYIGISILDLSKCHMVDFHYDFMQRKYGKKLKLLYTDTDSLIYKILTEDHYADMKDSLEARFNTADYPEDNQFGYGRFNKMEVGFFKDEFKGKVVEEFVALRPKVYALKVGDSIYNKAAGAPKVISEHFTIEDYKACLFKQESLYKEAYVIKAVGHKIYTQKIRKAVLQPRDPKRHLLENNIDSLPFGHYKLKEEH